MIHSFRDETTEDLFRERNTRSARRIPRDLWRGAQRKLKLLDAAETRATLGDGNFGGRYQRSDEDMLAVWQVAVEETRDIIDRGWP